jgi:3-hydroxyisobutyrate dehydrogenase-like beta-hydroxyacid dehydrogenase
MEIGTIGAGDFAQAFAKRALKAGHSARSFNRSFNCLKSIRRVFIPKPLRKAARRKFKLSAALLPHNKKL